MKANLQKFLVILSLLPSLNLFAQCELPAQYTGNTGSNMTVFFTPDAIDALPISSASPYLVAISQQSGQVVGSISIASDSQAQMAVWGDDTSTPEVDGALIGEELYLQLVDGNSLWDLSLILSLPNSYSTNAIQIVIDASATLNCSQEVVDDIYGCTDPTAYNFEPWATVDNGSCEPFIYRC